MRIEMESVEDVFRTTVIEAERLAIKQRRERIATAVLAGMFSCERFDGETFHDMAQDSCNCADKLIEILDLEPPTAKE